MLMKAVEEGVSVVLQRLVDVIIIQVGLVSTAGHTFCEQLKCGLVSVSLGFLVCCVMVVQRFIGSMVFCSNRQRRR